LLPMAAEAIAGADDAGCLELLRLQLCVDLGDELFIVLEVIHHLIEREAAACEGGSGYHAKQNSKGLECAHRGGSAKSCNRPDGSIPMVCPETKRPRAMAEPLKSVT